MLRKEVARGWQLVLLAALPLMTLAVFFTYTRSTWIGLVASAGIVGFLELPRVWRVPLFTLAALCGLLVAAVAWNDVIGLEREGSAGESHHSVDQRKSFAYVSWNMFKDNPVFGVGFGRFYDRKLPYLSDRSQEFELESLRPLHHHNTLLSVLVETGIVGLATFVAVLFALARNAWLLAKDTVADGWMQSQGVLMLAVLITYLSSAMFHDLTLLPSQQWVLFTCAGLTMNVRLRSFSTASWASTVDAEGNRRWELGSASPPGSQGHAH
jgi:O-antigen ligase